MDNTYTHAVMRWYKYDFRETPNLNQIELDRWLEDNFSGSPIQYVRLGKKVWFANEDHITICRLRWD